MLVFGNMQKTKSINLPKALIELFRNKEEARIEIARAAVMDLMRRGKISIHQGAEIFGMSDEDFLAMIKDERIRIIDYN